MKNTFLFFLFWLITTEGVTQSSYLEKNISLNAVDRPLGEVLKSMGKQAGCRMAYSPSYINEALKISLSVTDIKMRDVLRQILGDEFQFKQRDEYVIIKRLRSGERLYGGYIKDDKTGKKIENATVYDKRSLKSATTDKYGYYEIVTREPIEQLRVARVEYGDTTFQLKSLTATRDIDISMIPQTKIEVKEPIKVEIKEKKEGEDKYTEQTLLDNVDIKNFIKNYSDGFRRQDAFNVKDNLTRRWHWSVAPYLGNNGGLSGSVTNDYSINATVGYSNGNRKIEVGGLGNISRGNVKGLQVASLFNVVNDEMKGAQISGIINRTEQLKGIQISGIINSSDNLSHGWQVTGITNFTSRSRGGAQIAGIVNTAKSGKTGLQIAGIINNADTIVTQISLLNNANYVRGMQIGLLNICDTLNGVLLGFINVVKKGYHVLEIANNDLKNMTLSYKTGTHRFYTVYSAGMNINRAFAQDPLWSLGLGFGTNIRFSQRVHLTIDITNHHFSLGQFNVNTNELLRFIPALNVQFGKKIGIAVGPTFNAYTYKTTTPQLDVDIYKKGILPQWKVTQNGNWYTWFGAYAALRFF